MMSRSTTTSRGVGATKKKKACIILNWIGHICRRDKKLTFVFMLGFMFSVCILLCEADYTLDFVTSEDVNTKVALTTAERLFDILS
jgi:hypothetical protein